MRRRQILAMLALAGPLLVGGRARAWRRVGADPADRLVALLGRPASAAVVGQAYLASHPDEADRARLAAALASDLRCQGCDPQRAATAELRAGLAQRVRADFADGRIVQVDGWRLSVTEARWCALATLSAT